MKLEYAAVATVLALVALGVAVVSVGNHPWWNAARVFFFLAMAFVVYLAINLGTKSPTNLLSVTISSIVAGAAVGLLIAALNWLAQSERIDNNNVRQEKEAAKVMTDMYAGDERIPQYGNGQRYSLIKIHVPAANVGSVSEMLMSRCFSDIRTSGLPKGMVLINAFTSDPKAMHDAGEWVKHFGGFVVKQGEYPKKIG